MRRDEPYNFGIQRSIEKELKSSAFWRSQANVVDRVRQICVVFATRLVEEVRIGTDVRSINRLALLLRTVMIEFCRTQA